MKKEIRLKYLDQDSTVVTNEDGPFYQILNERYKLEFDGEPDYVIYGPFGDEHLKYQKAVKIFYTGECISPDFNLCDYAIGFDYLDYEDRYIRYPLWLKYGKEHNLRMESKQCDISNDLSKREFCSFVVSNDFADPMRDELFSRISEYKRVDSGGRYLNNIGQPQGVEDKLDFQKKYKFVLACENCSHSGYTTEKLMEAFEAQTVPIYWGDPNVAKDFNVESFVNFHDFDTIDEFIKEIQRIDTDDELYLKMLSEPALKNPGEGFAKREREVADFLFHIFDQPHEDAYRRNMQCWGKKYGDIQFAKKVSYDRIMSRKNAIKGLLKSFHIRK